MIKVLSASTKELIAEAKSLSIVRTWFRFNNSRKNNDIIKNRVNYSNRFNISVILQEVNTEWQSNQSIIFHKKLENGETK